MALQSSGQITFSDVNIELEFAAATALNLNNSEVRALFGKPTGEIKLSDGYSKDYGVVLATPVVTGSGLNQQVSFSWPAILNATSYDVYFDAETFVNQTALTFNRSGLEPSSTHSLQVVARGPRGFSASPTGTANATTYARLATPTISYVGAKNQITFTFTNNAGVTATLHYQFNYDGTWHTTSLAANSSTDVVRTVGSNITESAMAKVVASGWTESITQVGSGASLITLSDPTVAVIKKVNAVDFVVTNPNNLNIKLLYGFSGSSEIFIPLWVSPNSTNTITRAVSGDNTAATLNCYFFETGYGSSNTVNTTGYSLPALPGNPPQPTLSGGVNKITVTWAGVYGATSYNVKRDTTVISGVTSPFTDTGLDSGSQHTYSVQAQNERGTSGFSLTATGYVQPDQLSNFWLSDFTQTSVKFNFYAVTGATHYLVKTNGTWNLVIPNAALSDGPSGQKQYTKTGLAADTKTNFAMAAAVEVAPSSYISSAYSVDREAWTLYPDFSISAANKLSDRVTASFTAVAWSTYELYVDDAGQGGAQFQNTSGSILKTGLSPATTYSLKVGRPHLNGITYSNTVSVVTLPIAATAIESNVTKTDFTLSWSTAGTATTRVYVNNVDKGLQTSPYNLTGYSANTLINHTIRTYNSLNEYADGSGSFRTVQDTPAKPTVSVTSRAETSIAVSCTAVGTAGTGTITYDWYINWALFQSGTSTTCTFSGLATSTEYPVYVIAKTSNGNQISSDNTLVATILKVTDLRFWYGDQTSINVQWDCVFSSAVFKVSRDSVLKQESSSKYYSATNLSIGTGYSFNVVAGRWDSLTSAFVYDNSGAMTVTLYTNPPNPIISSTNSPGASQITISWSANGSSAGTLKYEVYKNGSYLTETTNTFAYDYVSQQTHSYMVRAVGKNGNNSDSNSVTLSSLSVPGTPTSVSMYLVGSWYGYVQFSAPASGGPVADYIIQFYRNSDNHLMYETTTTASPAVTTNLSASTSYRAVVVARNAAGLGGSAVVTFTTNP